MHADVRDQPSSRTNHHTPTNPQTTKTTTHTQAAVGLLVGIVWLQQAKTAEQKSIFPLTGALFIATTSSVLDTVFGCILTFPSMKVR